LDSGAPTESSSRDISMIAAPGGVDFTSMLPVVAAAVVEGLVDVGLGEEAGRGVGEGCVLAVSLLPPPQASAAAARNITKTKRALVPKRREKLRVAVEINFEIPPDPLSGWYAPSWILWDYTVSARLSGRELDKQTGLGGSKKLSDPWFLCASSVSEYQNDAPQNTKKLKMCMTTDSRTKDRPVPKPPFSEPQGFQNSRWIRLHKMSFNAGSILPSRPV
jgi:hypothetical protein